MDIEVSTLLKKEFPVSLAYTDKSVLTASYKKLMGRLAALVHIAPAIPAIQRITGQNATVLGAHSECEFVPDLFTCALADLEKWGEKQATPVLHQLFSFKTTFN